MSERLDDLYNKVVESGSSLALSKLGGYANGGDFEAREYIRRIETLKLTIVDDEIKAVSPSISIKDIGYIATHPLLALRTLARREEVGFDTASPPLESTIEEFPEMPFITAMRLMAEQSDTKDL